MTNEDLRIWVGCIAVVVSFLVLFVIFSAREHAYQKQQNAAVNAAIEALSKRLADVEARGRIARTIEEMDALEKRKRD